MYQVRNTAQRRRGLTVAKALADKRCHGLMLMLSTVCVGPASPDSKYHIISKPVIYWALALQYNGCELTNESGAI